MEDGEMADEFDKKDRQGGIGVIFDIDSPLRKAREECPVREGTISEHFGLEGHERLHFTDRDHYAALSFSAADQVLRDGETFSSSYVDVTFGGVIGRTILGMDAPDHRSYRGLLQGAFSRAAIAKWENPIVRPIVEDLIEGFKDQGGADLIKDYAFHIAFRVVAAASGMAGEHVDEYYRIGVVITNPHASPEERAAASEELAGHIRHKIAERRQEPNGDLVSILLEGTVDGRPLEEYEIVDFMRLLLPAGAQTVYRSLGNLLFGLLGDPAQFEAVRDDRSLIPQAIEEAIRWEPPLTAVGRVVAQPTTLDGVNIAAGCPVHVSLSSADHDRERWDDPEVFNLYRKPRPHLAFGGGPHLCLGIHLARLELRVGLESLLDHFENIRFDPAFAPPRMSGMLYRTPESLPVLFEIKQ
jgi:cytochrome P450